MIPPKNSFAFIRHASAAVALGVCVLFTPWLDAAGEDFEAAGLLDENTAFLVQAPDLAALVDGFEESALGSFFADEQVADFFRWGTPGETDGPSGFFGEEMSRRWERFGHLFDGGFALGVTVPELELPIESIEDLQVEDRFAIVAAFSGSVDEFADFMEPFSDMNSENQIPGTDSSAYEEEFLGHTMYIEEVSMDGDLIRRNGWVVLDGRAILAQPVDYLRDVLVRFEDPSEESSLLESIPFLDAKDRAEEADFSLFVNMGFLAEFINESIRVGLVEAMAESPNPFGLVPDSVVRALGLASMRTIEISGSFRAESSTLNGAFTFERNRGLLSLFSYKNAITSFPSIVPEDVLSAGIAKFDWMESWLGIKEMLKQASPSLGTFIEMGRNNFTQMSGVDFETDLIANIGDSLITFANERISATPGTEEVSAENSVIALELEDPSGFLMAIETLKNLYGLGAYLEEKTFEGSSIYTFSGEGMDGEVISYAVTGNFLLFGVGEDGLLEATVSRMGERSGGFWNQPELQDLLEELPKDLGSLSYTDLDYAMENLMLALANLQFGMNGKDTGRFQVENIPEDPILNQFVLSGLVQEENGVFFRSIILPKGRLDP